jgi:hypothetical protein
VDIVALHLSGDTLPDLAVVSGYSGGEMILLQGVGANGVGSGAFTEKQRITLLDSERPIQLLPQDFNQDGVTDLALLEQADNNSSVSNAAVRVYLAGSDGSFSPLPAVRTTAGTDDEGAGLVGGDFNSDGKPDVAVLGQDLSSTGYYQGFVQVLLNSGEAGGKGTGTLVPGSATASKYLRFSGAVTADVDDDGLTDIVTAETQDDDTIVTLVGSGAVASVKGSFTPADTVSAAPSSSLMRIGHVDLDVIPDLVTASGAQESVSVMHGNATNGKPNGTFGSPVSYALNGSPVALELADLNQDGFMDIITANNSDNDVSILLGTSNGTFAEAAVTVTGGRASALAVVDLNDDGALDLAVADQANHRVSVLAANLVDGAPHGSFTALEATAVNNPRCLAVADFNADDMLDVAVGTSTDGLVVLLAQGSLGKANGTFVAQPQVTSQYLSAVAVVELNGDIALDLVAINSSHNAISIFAGLIDSTTGLPDGRFQPPTADYLVEDGPSALLVADLTRDHMPDLLVANAAANSLSVMAGQSVNGLRGGSFGAAVHMALPAAPGALLQTDLNSDGAPDLLVAMPEANAIQAFTSNVKDLSALPASYFDSDDEGWVLTGDSLSATETAVDHTASGGNPGGYISEHVVSQNGNNYWKAPEKFRGDLSDAVGNTLHLDLWVDYGASMDVTTQILVFSEDDSGNVTLLESQLPYEPADMWTRYAVPISEGYGWADYDTGAVCTNATLQKVFSDVDDLWILASWGSTYANMKLDSVQFKP